MFFRRLRKRNHGTRRDRSTTTADVVVVANEASSSSSSSSSLSPVSSSLDILSNHQNNDCYDHDEYDKKTAILDSLLHLRLRGTVDSNTKHEICHVCCEGHQDGDIVTTLPCGHMHHSECIVNWLQRQLTCPVCRSEITIDNTLQQKHNTVESILDEKLSKIIQEQGNMALITRALLFHHDQLKGYDDDNDDDNDNDDGGKMKSFKKYFEDLDKCNSSDDDDDCYDDYSESSPPPEPKYMDNSSSSSSSSNGGNSGNGCDDLSSGYSSGSGGFGVNDDDDDLYDFLR